jgi:hypothetical protein
MTILFTLRTASVTGGPSNYDLLFSENVRFNLKSFAGPLEIRLEDNPCVHDADKLLEKERFTDLKSEYPPFTTSAVTPNIGLSPQMCVECIREIQKMDEETFYQLCLSCYSLVTNNEDEFLDIRSYFQKWSEQWPAAAPLSPMTQNYFCQLAHQYNVSIEQFSQPLLAGAKITFDPDGIDAYANNPKVPEYMKSEGNFASALAVFFDIHDTLLHDGNCAINSFFAAKDGPELYQGEEGERRIRDQIGPFRKKIVDYAKKHKADFPEDFRDQYQRMIRNYNDSTQRDWTGLPELWVAAQVYEQEIRIFSRLEGDFTVDDKGQIAPLVVFTPIKNQSIGEQEGISPRGDISPKKTKKPINLYFGYPHFCPLIPKKPANIATDSDVETML